MGFGVVSGVFEGLAGVCIYLFLQFIYKLCTCPATSEKVGYLPFKSLALKYPFFKTLFFLYVLIWSHSKSPPKALRVRCFLLLIVMNFIFFYVYFFQI